MISRIKIFFVSYFDTEYFTNKVAIAPLKLNWRKSPTYFSLYIDTYMYVRI